MERCFARVCLDTRLRLLLFIMKIMITMTTNLMTRRNKNKWPGKGSSDDKPDNLVFILPFFSSHCSLYSRIIFTNSAFKQFELFTLQCSITQTGPTGLFISYNTIEFKPGNSFSFLTIQNAGLVLCPLVGWSWFVVG